MPGVFCAFVSKHQIISGRTNCQGTLFYQTQPAHIYNTEYSKEWSESAYVRKKVFYGAAVGAVSLGYHDFAGQCGGFRLIPLGDPAGELDGAGHL